MVWPEHRWYIVTMKSKLIVTMIYLSLEISSMFEVTVILLSLRLTFRPFSNFLLRETHKSRLQQKIYRSTILKTIDRNELLIEKTHDKESQNKTPLVLTYNQRQQHCPF